MKRTKCPNCGTEHDGKFCPNCATPVKKKKKFLVPVIIIVVLIVLIAGMGGKEEQPEQPSSVKGDVTLTTEPEREEAAQQQPPQQTQSDNREVTIQETELYNNGGIVVTATELTDGFFGPEVKVTVSNDTDKNVIITSREVSVNGYMLPASSLYCDVAAGKKAVETLTLMRSEMDAAGIDTIAEIAFWLHISDSDTYDSLDDSDLITVTTSAADFVQPVDDSGDVIYENKDIRVVCKGLKKDLIWDGTVVFYVENNRGEKITVCTENVSVNGFMVDESMWTDLRAGTRCITGMYLLSMEDQGIESLEDVKTIELTLRIIDGDWDEIDTSDVITLNFE